MTETISVVIDNAPTQIKFYDANTREAQLKALQADSARAAAQSAQTATEYARDQAADLVNPANIFIDVPIGTAEAAVSTGTTFKLVSSITGIADVRKRTGGGSDLLYQEATKTALENPVIGPLILGVKRAGTGALNRVLDDVVQERPFDIAEYSSFAQALSAADSLGEHGTVQLTQGQTIALVAGISFDTMRVSVLGQNATINASQIGAGTAAITVDSNADSPVFNSYAYKGQLSHFRLFGAEGIGIKDAVGIDMNGSVEAGAAQVYSLGARVANFSTGIKFSNRAYNSAFFHTEVFFADVCVHWPSGGTDNGERNTFYAPTFFNSTRGFLNEEPSSTIVQNGGSIDYTSQIGKVIGGKAMLTDMHLESRYWGNLESDPYALHAAGDGGYIRVSGGFFLNAAPAMSGKDLIYVGANAKVLIDGSFLHNFTLTPDTTAGAPQPTCFFTGEGAGTIRDTHGFLFGALPHRVHANRSRLIDPNFELGTTDDFFDPIYITADTQPIANPRNNGGNLVLTKVDDTARLGSRSLKVAKAFGPGSVAEFTLIDIPVRPGEKPFAGFQFCTDPATPGISDSDRTASVGIYWAKRRIMSANGLPVEDRLVAIGTENIIASDQYKMWNWVSDLQSRTAPDWADRLIIRINMFLVNQLSMRFDALHADGIS